MASAGVAGAGPPAGAPRHRPVTIDFAEDGGDAPLAQHTGPPPDIQHPSLMKDKYRGVADEAAGAELEDPLARPVSPTTGRPHWLGLRLAGGMFDDSAASARAGIAVGVAGRYRL